MIPSFHVTLVAILCVLLILWPLCRLLVAVVNYNDPMKGIDHDFRLLAVCRGNGRIPLYSINTEYDSYYKLLLAGGL